MKNPPSSGLLLLQNVPNVSLPIHFTTFKFQLLWLLLPKKTKKTLLLQKGILFSHPYKKDDAIRLYMWAIYNFLPVLTDATGFLFSLIFL